MADSSKAKSKKTPTAAKAAPKKAAKPVAAAKPVVAAKVTKPAVAPKKAVKGIGATRKPDIPLEQRRNYVEVAAYYIAERHGFTPGRELADWAAAEAEIERLLRAGLLNP